MTTHREIVKTLPTKEFFVEMLVKDVSLNSAIKDLVDNSIDGALRLRKRERLDGLFIRITLSDREFKIEDNCGGIPLEIAKEYAFRFGRDPFAPRTESSLGLFGVGMKRAVFKLGRTFEVESTSDRNSFKVNVNVDEWKKESEWNLEMEAQEYPDDVPETDRGTKVSVTDLYDSVSSQFNLSLFASRLLNEIATAHQTYLERGLDIRVNRRSVVGAPVKFAFVPGHLSVAQEEINQNGIAVRLFSGVGERGAQARADAGWYVYCNGRMVVKADQTELTGWGIFGTTRIPKYHHQFARFRGCAFFTSADSRELPWNTTKDGLDVESNLFRSVKLRMVSHMRPVINFLNRLDDELDLQDEDARVLTKMLESAQYLSPGTLPESAVTSSFTYKRPIVVRKPPPHSRISFTRPKTLVDNLKRCLGVTSNNKAGEMTFDWYLENECDDQNE